MYSILISPTAVHRYIKSYSNTIGQVVLLKFHAGYFRYETPFSVCALLTTPRLLVARRYISNQISTFGSSLERLSVEDVAIFYGYLVYFHPFWSVVPRKIWQPCSTPTLCETFEPDIRMYCLFHLTNAMYSRKRVRVRSPFPFSLPKVLRRNTFFSFEKPVFKKKLFRLLTSVST
jgi:hypothetical protein